ncbi:MAG: M1 family metallopeptidase [Bacteroidetes bacterium]|nr:M1 family metallopeptidase [Bacteroidota bacterium]
MRLISALSLLFWVIFSSLYASDDYWQQQVDFNIVVSLNDTSKMLNGSLEMQYHNNSEDELNKIWIHLWPNAYSKRNTAFAQQQLQHGSLLMNQLDRKELGAIGKLDFTGNGEKLAFIEDKKHPDIGYIQLNEPLKPGSSIIIKTPFKVKLPKLVSRMGYDGDFFAVSQWYPKPAVYDEEGWHPMPYLEQGEFYSEFGNFNVTIRVPDRFKVAATGNKIFADTAGAYKTLIYEQDNVLDFAWFASPDFKLVQSPVELSNGRKVMVQTYHTTDAERWKQCHKLTENALLFYSEKVGPYPYDHCTIVEGPLESGGGMEYPTISVVTDSKNAGWMETVVAHEVGHNWWQGILASNERRFPWIDEGFNSYYEFRYNQEAAITPFHPEEAITRFGLSKMFDVDHIDYDGYEKLMLLQEERMNRQQATGITSEDFTQTNYNFQAYLKTSKFIAYLEQYLGTAQFDVCIWGLYDKYAFRHFGPEDIREYFESCSGKDLGFLFEDRINSDGIVNSKIKGLKKLEDGYLVELKHTGDVIMPLPLVIESETHDTTIWIEAGQEEVIVSEPGVTRISLDPDNLSLDYNLNNNFIKTKGFKKIEQIRPQFLASLENPQRSQLFFMPVIAGNTHDKFMLGMSFYNRVYPAKNVDWDITPFYAFGSKQANGIFNFSYYQNIRKDRHAQLEYKTHFKTFSYNNSSAGGRYLNFSPSLTATILPENRNSNITHKLQWKHHQNWKEFDQFEKPDSILIYIGKLWSSLWVEDISYSVIRKDVKTPVNATAYMQFNNEHVKVGTELNFKVRYGKIKSYFSGRFLIEGIAFKRDENATSSQLVSAAYRSGLGGTAGSNDYLFEHYYLGRSQTMGFASQQVFMDQGQFKFSNASLLRANALVSSVNVTADFPSKWIPIKLYMDFGLAVNEGGSALFAFQAGGMLSLFDEGIEIYFPFFSSDEIKGFYDLNVPKYKNRITFSFDMDKINPHKRVREFKVF